MEREKKVKSRSLGGLMRIGGGSQAWCIDHRFRLIVYKGDDAMDGGWLAFATAKRCLVLLQNITCGF